MKKLTAILLCVLLLLPGIPAGAAYEIGAPCRLELDKWIQDPDRRDYVEMMLDYHMRTNSMVKDALAGGFAAVFLFDGCSDNMKDAELSDLSYYRVSGVCVVVKLDGAGEPRILYFNDNCSTIPDRPLEYGAWSLPEVGDVGPATVLDGTYQMYSVRHKGKYEALHVRTEYYDALLDAVYMMPEGFETARASEINIHTRTSNHTSGVGMWSAGCPLVGDGDAWEFWKLMEAVYYSTYDSFELDNFAGTLTIDRTALRTEMYTLYANPDAVDWILTNSRKLQPETYLRLCSDKQVFEEPLEVRTNLTTQLMTLPCSNETDARSLLLAEISKGERIAVTGSIQNSAGNVWYLLEYGGKSGYIYSGHIKQKSWLQKTFEELFA